MLLHPPPIRSMNTLLCEYEIRLYRAGGYGIQRKRLILHARSSFTLRLPTHTIGTHKYVLKTQQRCPLLSTPAQSPLTSTISSGFCAEGHCQHVSLYLAFVHGRRAEYKDTGHMLIPPYRDD